MVQIEARPLEGCVKCHALILCQAVEDEYPDIGIYRQSMLCKILRKHAEKKKKK